MCIRMMIWTTPQAREKSERCQKQPFHQPAERVFAAIKPSCKYFQ